MSHPISSRSPSPVSSSSGSSESSLSIGSPGSPGQAQAVAQSLLSLSSSLSPSYSSNDGARKRSFSVISENAHPATSDPDQPPQKRVALDPAQTVILATGRVFPAESGADKRQSAPGPGPMIMGPSAPPVPLPIPGIFRPQPAGVPAPQVPATTQAFSSQPLVQFHYPTGWFQGSMDAAGRRHGRGSMYYNDSKTFHGEWKDDRQHGPGRLKNPVTRMTVQGIWQEGLPPRIGTCTWKAEDGLRHFFVGTLQEKDWNDLRPLAGIVTGPNGTTTSFGAPSLQPRDSTAWTTSQPTPAPVAQPQPPAMAPLPRDFTAWTTSQPTPAPVAPKPPAAVQRAIGQRWWEQVDRKDPEYQEAKRASDKVSFLNRGPKSKVCARFLEQTPGGPEHTGLLWGGPLDMGRPRCRGVYIYKGRVWGVDFDRKNKADHHNLLRSAILAGTSKADFEEQNKNQFSSEEFALIKWPEDQPPA